MLLVVDMMFHVFCQLGYPVALDKAAQGMGLPGKPQGISGILAPKMWADGQHQQVLDYVAQDVRITLQLAEACRQNGSFAWITRKGSRRDVCKLRRASELYCSRQKDTPEYDETQLTI